MFFALIFSQVLAFDLTEIQVGQISKSISVPKGCSVFHIGTNYQRTSLHFSTDTLDLEYIRWANILTETCDRPKCPLDSTVCGEVQSMTSSESIIGTCISDLYIYVKAKADTKFHLAVQYITGECDKIVENLYTQCGSMNYAECDRCDDECRLAECIRSKRYNSEEKILMNLCLPYTVSDDEISERCLSYKGVDVGTWKQDCDNSIDIGSVGAGTVVALVLIMMSFFGFVGAVAWYNWKMKMTGTPPIKCCKFCPDVLFPRPRQMQMPSSYRPPDVSLQTFK